MEENKEVNQSKKKNNKLIFIIFGIVIVILIAVVVFLVLKLNNNTAIEANGNINIANNKNDNTKTISFKSMEETDTNLTDNQKEIAKFFDGDNFFLSTYEELIRYADMLKNIHVSTYCQVNTIISSDDKNFEAICQWGSDISDFYGGGLVELTNPIIIKGNKPEKMVIPEDYLALRGILVGAETRVVNGESKYLPVIEITEIGENSTWFSESTLKNVAKAVFGNDIKFRKPTDEEMYKMCECSYVSLEDYIYLAEFENQSNLNFKVFDIWQSVPTGMITYNYYYNQGIEKDYLNKRLYVTPDLQKYIVFDISQKDKKAYISVYDRNYNKLWQRELNDVSNISWDSTDKELIFVHNNDLYRVNIESGENISDPIYVGQKDDIRIVDNGYLLINQSANDSVMFLDKNGNIKNKFNIKLGNNNQPNQEIYSISCQKLDNNYVILYSICDADKINSTDSYYSEEEIFSSKYVIIDENGNKLKESE